VAAEVSRCTACRLHQSATRGVPGEGPDNARIMFVGEAPGYHEDRQARPFVGPAGKLLEELLAGIGLRREDVFITNVVKHRPPSNRDPLPEEIAACRPFLERQIGLIGPEIVGLLGRFAMEQFMPGARIGQAHGKPRRLGDRVLVPLVHPAAALHRGDWRPLLESDFLALRRVLDDADAAAAETPKPPDAEQLTLF
jgi:DNA polymerase